MPASYLSLRDQCCTRRTVEGRHAATKKCVRLYVASFYGVNHIWLLFLLGAIDVDGCSMKATEKRLAALLTIPVMKCAPKHQRRRRREAIHDANAGRGCSAS